ncbi:UvrABC system protein C [Chlamydiales bacterium STE3]|nr:UvrABC system protein C [Chlamydiales bacterium STE3]
MSFDVSKLKAFSTFPGVYIMRRASGEVLYVGKAKNIKARVRQYFLKGGDGRFMVPFLVSYVDEIETIVVTSEKEALLLENNLIKQHRPKFNALLKDDKSYIALKINHKHPWPKIELTRYKGKLKKDGRYFGPYTSAFAARKTLDLLQKMFPMRQCSDQELLRRKRPCILYGMQRCIAPCVGLCSKDQYNSLVDNAIKFLKGQDREILPTLNQEMQRASELLEFERAKELWDLIRQIENTLEGQSVDKPLGEDADVLAIFRQGDEVILSQLYFRGGRMIGTKNHNFSKIAEDDAELLETFLLQCYSDLSDPPHEIFLPFELQNGDVIEEIISQDKKRKIRLYTPKKGEKRGLVELALKNAQNAFATQKDEKSIRERTLLQMQEQLKLSRYPRRIECFDNSNLSGDEPVAALVAFTEGEKDTQYYRKYKIRAADRSDDYGAMKEVLTRRYQKTEEKNNLPDLIIVDGGKGHLNMALKVLRELNIISVDVIGLAKEEGRHDKGATLEQIFLPEVKDPILLPRHSPILFLLQKIRDESHRVAISFLRKRHSKKTVKTALVEIAGIGPEKSKRLLKHFGSLQKVSEATEEQLKEVAGLSESNIISILKFF